MDKERRFYICTGQVVGYSKLHTHPKAHILGEIVSLTESGRRVTALAVWNIPVPTDTVPPINPAVNAWLIDGRLRCKVAECGRNVRWEIGQAAFAALMERYGHGRETEMPDLRVRTEIQKVVEPTASEKRGTG